MPMSKRLLMIDMVPAGTLVVLFSIQVKWVSDKKQKTINGVHVGEPLWKIMSD